MGSNDLSGSFCDLGDLCDGNGGSVGCQNGVFWGGLIQGLEDLGLEVEVLIDSLKLLIKLR